MSFGDCRKSKAYQVEANFYQNAAKELQRELLSCCRQPGEIQMLKIPQLYHLERQNKSITMCMEWIEGRTLGYDTTALNVKKTLRWLAQFHAASWGGCGLSGSAAGASSDVDDLVERWGLHPIGSYWHLETRASEHADMPRRGWEGRLKTAARAVHECLQRDPMQCLIHGDVKSENVLLMPKNANNPSSDGDDDETTITMCDYQYTGKGPPTKDLAYFFCSSVDLSSEAEEEEYLKFYYEDCLLPLLTTKYGTDSPVLPSFDHLKASLELSYVDFCRFMAGWGYWGDVPALKKRTQTLLAKLDHGKHFGSEQAYDEAIRRMFW